MVAGWGGAWVRLAPVLVLLLLNKPAMLNLSGNPAARGAAWAVSRRKVARTACGRCRAVLGAERGLQGCVTMAVVMAGWMCLQASHAAMYALQAAAIWQT